MDFTRLSCTYEIELFATQPLIVGTSDLSVTLRNGTPTGPVTRLMVLSGRPVRPFIKYAGVTNPRITNIATGEYFDAVGTGNFDVSTTVRDRPLPPGSTWPVFGTGEHFLRLTNGNTSAPATATLLYKESWM